MEEKELTPEQEEMQVYEKYAERLGPEGALALYADVVKLAGVAVVLLNGVLREENTSDNDSEAHHLVREEMARMQIVLNIMQIVFGDIAEEECAIIEALKIIDEDADGMK